MNANGLNFLDHLWMGTSSLRDEIGFHYDYERGLIMGVRARMMGYFTLLTEEEESSGTFGQTQLPCRRRYYSDGGGYKMQI